MTILETGLTASSDDQSDAKAVFGYHKAVLTQRRQWLAQLKGLDDNCPRAKIIKEELADIVIEFADQGLMTDDGTLTPLALAMGLEL